VKILVTGTTGFIGSHLAVHLAACGHEVIATARQPEKLAILSSLDGIRQARLDLQDRAGWTGLLTGCDAVAHVALGWGETGPAMLEHDTAASVALLEAAREAGVGKFLYTSSTAANGEMSPANHADRAARPVDLYGATKAATEMFCRSYANTSDMSVHVVRPGYVFGEPAIKGARSQPDQRFHALCESVRNGTPVHLIRHDGTQFLHVRDLVRVYAKLLEHSAKFSIHYALSARWRAWGWVAQEAMRIAGLTLPLDIEDRGYGETPWTFDVSGMRDDLGLSFDNEDRLREHLKWGLSREL